MISKLKMLKNRPLIDVWHYLIGKYRYKLYYKKFKIDYQGYRTNEVYKHPLMRQYIWEQITWRINVMNPKCYNQGQCVVCGCETTALQMASKGCDGLCYPRMLNEKTWNQFKTGKFHLKANENEVCRVINWYRKPGDDGYRFWNYTADEAKLFQTMHLENLTNNKKSIEYVQINEPRDRSSKAQ